MSYDYDLFVIGAGSGGVRAARLAGNLGAKVAVAESYKPGGTCVVRGCIPKKYMVYASEMPREIEHMAAYGFEVVIKNYDHNQFMTTLHHEVDRLSGLYASGLEGANATLFREHAQITGPHELLLKNSGTKITAKRILIATGGWPFFPENIEGIELAISSNEAFHLDALPKSIIIYGGGYIAVEFAGIFNGLGVDTTLIYRGPQILRGFDEAVRTEVQAAMEARGITFITEDTITTIKEADAIKEVKLNSGQTLTCDEVMFATGRKPNSDELGLESVGVEVDASGAIKVDQYSKTNIEHIWAVGDVTDRMALTPVAIREAAAFIDTEFRDLPTYFDYSNVPTAVFSQPAIGTVGLSEDEAKAKFSEVYVYESRFRAMKTLLAGDDEKTYIKLITAEIDERVVGCHIVGHDGPEIIQAVAIAIKMGATKREFDATCALHPSAAEELVTLKDRKKVK